MFNLSAIYTIVASRLREFFQEYHYSLLAPLTTNILFILVFLTVENYYSLSIDSGSFVEFIAPGLIIMIVGYIGALVTSIILLIANFKENVGWGGLRASFWESPF